MAGIVAARVACCVLTALALVGARGLRAGVPDPSMPVQLERLPHEIGAWSGTDIEIDADVLAMLGPDSHVLREYEREGEPPVSVFVDYHRVQRLGAQIHSPRVCYPGAGWVPRHVEIRTERLAGREGPVCWLRLRHEEWDLLAAYWYVSRWGSSARETDLKVGMVRSAFARRPSDAALVRFSTPVAGDGFEGARERLLRFIDEVEPLVSEQLPFDAPSA